VVVLLEVQLVWVVQASVLAVPERMVRVAQLAQEALGLVLGVLAGLVAIG